MLISKGKISFLYSDSLLPLTSLGKTSIHRVSNVEPDINGKWVAHIIGGPSLGPYDKRQDALDAEVAYLEHQMMGVCPGCGGNCESILQALKEQLNASPCN